MTEITEIEEEQAKTNKNSFLLYYQYFTIHFGHFNTIFYTWSKMFLSKFRGSHSSLEKKKGHFHLSGKLPPVYTRNWNFNFCKDKSASMRDVKVISQARGSWIQYLWFGKTKPNFILALQQIMRSCPQLVNFHQPCWSIMDLELHEHIHFRRDSSLCQC